MAKTPSLKKPKAAPVKCGSKEIGRYLELREERLRMEAEARANLREERELAKQILAYAVAKGGPNRTLIRCGHRLSVLSKPGSVSWKTEFRKALGAECVQKLEAAAEPRDMLQVEKA